MRNLKKFLALVMAVLMVMSVAVMTGVSAADEADHTEAAHHLNSLSIMKGNENGDLMLANGVTRYQAALFFVQALTGKTDVSVWNAEKKSAIFNDVVEYGTAIDYAYNINIVRGRGNGVYGYNDPITYQDMLVMAVRALGYETENMQYPYGYILAAQKLELDEDLDELVNFKADLNRGQTAEIIWNMLNQRIAVDVNGIKVYPDEKLDTIYRDTPIENKNKTLLEKAGFAEEKVSATILDVKLEDLKADEDPYVKVKMVYSREEWVDENDQTKGKKPVSHDFTIDDMKPEDFGITVDTPKSSYLGLPLQLYLDCEADKFEEKYEKEDATVVSVDFGGYTTVENLGDAGNIKFVVDEKKQTLTLGSDKFELVDKKGDKKITLSVYTLDKKGWKATTANETSLKNAFVYDTEEKEYTGTNTYGKVQYKTVENDDGDVVEVVVLYTPYTFAQYFVRNLKDATTAKKADFVTVAKYEASFNENLDKVKTHFVEYYLDDSDMFGKVATTDTEGVVSRSQGQFSKAVKLTGESIKSGDFFIGAYNRADNILEVAFNAGTFQTGRLTARTIKNGDVKAVKIGGTNYNFGFKGCYTLANSDIEAIVDGLEAGKDNAKYIVVDGNVVYAEKTEKNNSSDAKFPYAVVAFNGEYLEDALNEKDGNLTVGVADNKLTKDLFYIKDGKVQIAVLDMTTGEWKAATLTTFNKDYVDADDEFKTEIDAATVATYADITAELTGKTKSNWDYLQDNIKKDAQILAVVEEKSGAYTLALPTDEVTVADNNNTKCTKALTFSDDNAKTNAITADKDVDAARVTLNADSVIIILTKDGKVGIRKGVQKHNKSVKTLITYYSANSDLIFGTVDVNESDVTFESTLSFDDWNTGKRIDDSAATYYVITEDTEISKELYKDENDNKTYTFTANGLFDLRTGKVVDNVVETKKTDSSALWNNKDNLGAVIHVDDEGEFKLYTAASSANAASKTADLNYGEDGKYTALTLDGFKFKDDSTLVGTVGGQVCIEDTALAGINVKVTTVYLNKATVLEKYDMDNLYTNQAFNADSYKKDGISSVKVITGKDTDTNEDITKDYFAYALTDEVVEEITAPTVGVFNQFIIDMNNTEGLVIRAPKAGEDPNNTSDAEVKVNLIAAGRWDSNKGEAYIEVIRLVKVIEN